MYITKRQGISVSRNGAGTRFESHMRVINGKAYRFYRTTKANGRTRIIVLRGSAEFGLPVHVWGSLYKGCAG